MNVELLTYIRNETKGVTPIGLLKEVRECVIDKDYRQAANILFNISMAVDAGIINRFQLGLLMNEFKPFLNNDTVR